MTMNIRLSGYALVLICSFAPQAIAQQWLSHLPQEQREQPTIDDLRRDFESYYREHPVDLTRDKLKPIFRFARGQEEIDRRDVEEYKMFRRWEWLVEPRAHPSGKLDLEQLAGLRAQVRKSDTHLIAKLPARSPLTPRYFQADWKPLGPSNAVGGTNMGRVNCIEFDPKNVNTIYLCSADGGVWKSTNGGSNWSSKSDFELTVSAADIAIDRNNTNVVYVATGDSFGYGIPFWGGTYSVGVIKSVDGGTTWTPTRLIWTVAQNRTIRRLVMHPTDANIVLAA